MGLMESTVRIRTVTGALCGRSLRLAQKNKVGPSGKGVRMECEWKVQLFGC